MASETTGKSAHMILREPPTSEAGNDDTEKESAVAAVSVQQPHRQLSSGMWQMCCAEPELPRRLQRCWPEEAAAIVQRQISVMVAQSILADILRNLPPTTSV